MDATPRWMQIMQRAPDDIPLDEAALLIAAHANPALDVAEELARLDRIATQVDHPDTGALCRTLFHEMGLSGDRQNYDDPRNSYLDQVLARRRGIPISLSVLLLEIGRRCGLRLEGVGMPGHFLVRDPDRPELLIDAFDQGRRLGPAECERLFQSITGTGSPLTQAMLATTDRWAF